MEKKEWNRFSKLVVRYSWTFIAILVLGWLLQIGTAIFFPQVINSLAVFKLQILGLFSINIIGFVIPLSISLILIFKMALIDKVEIGTVGLWTIVSGIALLVLSLWLPISNVHAQYAAMNVPIMAVALINLFYHVYKKDYKLAMSISYVLGFLAAFSSDFVATFGIVKTAGGVWGGAGLVDGDFLIPIIIVLTVLLIKRWQIGQKN